MGFFSSLSFLTPLYVAAGLAVTLPILFHLMRRTPRGRQEFSSVMFLTPSPPRITRRSRIEHWLLLLLRAAAVMLIVAAFCRPLWRQPLAAETGGAGQEVVVLLDNSASMRRNGVWPEAIATVRAIVDEAKPADQFSLLLFDEQVTPLVDTTSWNQVEAGQRKPLVEAKLKDLVPGWRGTDLGRALMAAADRLEQSSVRAAGQARQRIVVISDLQEGSRWESLQGTEWPAGIEVELKSVGLDAPPTNAGLQIVGRPEIAEKPFVRVRVSNAANSKREGFQLGWLGEFDGPQGAAKPRGLVDVYVPPGQSRVVRLESPELESNPGRVVLMGDDQPFDNVCSVAWPRRNEDTVVYLGPDAADDRTGLRFFLGPLFAESSERKVTIVGELPFEAAVEGADGSTPASSVSLVIVAGSLDGETVGRLRAYLQQGGTALFVCRDAESSGRLYELAAAPPAPVTEAEITDYAMLRDVAFKHPLFAALDDPRFSDLSKVHFWHHRTLDATSLPGLRVLASFDDGAPAFAELAVGNGKLVVLTSGWSRGDSELATWSKFVPIMNALLAYGRRAQQQSAQVTVGESLPLTMPGDASKRPRAVVRPGGERTVLDTAEGRAPRALIADRPGLYRIEFDDAGTEGARLSVAANLPADESRTAPLKVDLLESLGVQIAATEEQAAVQARNKEQLARRELESHQKLWRWLVVAALAVLAVETLLAGRQGRRIAFGETMSSPGGQ